MGTGAQGAGYKAGLAHANKVRRKQERLEGLEALYATYEKLGSNPADSPAMRMLKKRIHSTRAQLKVMGTDVIPGEASAERGDWE